MGYRSLRDYLEALEKVNLLVRVEEELSPELEIPTILLEAMKAGGPALLFEKVRGYPGWRVAGNLFGTWRHLEIAFGTRRLEEVGERILSLLPLQPPTSLVEKAKTLARLAELSKIVPRRVRRGPVQEVVLEGDKARLDAIPAFKTWPRDASRYLTFPLVVVREPDTGAYNIGVYRVMILDSKRAVIHWQIHKRGAEAADEYTARGRRRIPVAIVVGGPPHLLFAGVAPVPKPLDKYVFASLVGWEPLELVEASNGLLVPAHAELVLEGYVDPEERVMEGPFGDHYGYYTPPAPYPVFHLERITMRSDPIYYGTIVGKPYCEDAMLGKAVERVFLPILRMMLPEIVDVNLPPHGLFQGLAIVSIRKRYPGHAKKVMMALWGLGQFSLTKILIVVDHDVDVHDLNQVVYAVAANVDPQRDVVIVPGAPVDVLDHATPTPGYGSKLGIDATRKLPEEYNGKTWPEQVEPDPRVLEKVKPLLERVLEGWKKGGTSPRHRPGHA